MIAELFYPKELKDVIADLRAKDDLNEEALNQVNRHIYRSLRGGAIVSLVFMLVLVFNNASFGFWVLVCCFSLFCPVSVYFSFQKNFTKYARLYNYGLLVEGVCEHYSVFGPSFGMSASTKFDDIKTLSRISDADLIFRGKKYNKGDPVYVVYDPVNPDINAPFIQSLADVFYLRKNPRHAI